MADSTTNLDLISASQSSKEVTSNNLSDAGSPATLYGRRASTTSGLTWGYYGGKKKKADGTIASIANGIATLTNNATNYVYATDAGVVTVVTAAPAGWPAPLASDAIALYAIVTSGGLVTSYTDYRVSGGGNGGSTNASNVTVTDAGNYYTGANAEAALQELGPGTELVFTSDTDSITDADPGAGLFKWNNATQASATALYVDNTTAQGGVDVSTYFANLTSEGFIHLVQKDDPTKWQIWKWGALPINGTGYYKFTSLTLMASGGSIADNKAVSVALTSKPSATDPVVAGFFYPGAPTASVLVGSFAAPAGIPTITYASAISGSSGKALTAATAQTDFDVRKNATTAANGTSVGTIRFAAAGTVPTFIAASGFTLTGGSDWLTVWAPASPDATLANIAVSLYGTR